MCQMNKDRLCNYLWQNGHEEEEERRTSLSESEASEQKKGKMCGKRFKHLFVISRVFNIFFQFFKITGTFQKYAGVWVPL